MGSPPNSNDSTAAEVRTGGSARAGIRHGLRVSGAAMGQCYPRNVKKRLQVLLPGEDLVEIRWLARREGLTVSEWVRRALREARESKPVNDPETKLKAIRRAAEFSFPTADIEQMLEEIEPGSRV